MKKLALIYFLFQFNWLAAQQITVLSRDDKNPLAGVTVTLQNAGQFFYLSADGDGKVQLLEGHFKKQNHLLVQLSFIGFQTVNDTIFKRKDKIFYLTPISYMINEMVITAQYSPTSVDKSVHKVKVISRQKIERMAAVNLQDILTNELNVRLSRDNILGSGMSLQGMSGQNVKILIDGVPVIGRLDGQIDLNQINLNNVERIEIVEGPLSVNYGSNALAGTINIITKKEVKQRVSFGINAYTENIGTYNLETNLGLSPLKNHNIFLSLGRNYFDGWSSKDAFFPSFKAQRADSGRVKQWNPKEQYFGRLQYNYNYQKMLFGYKAEFFDESISNYGLPRRTANSYVAFDDYYYTQRIDNAIFVKGELNNNWSLNWTTAYNDFERVKEAMRKDLVSLKSKRIPETQTNDLQDTSSFSLFMSRGSIASTKDSTWLNFEIGYDINLEKAAGKRIEGGEQQLGDYAAFLSTELKLTSEIILKPAVRYAYNTQYEAPVTPSFHLKYAKKKSIFRFSYAKGFRAPSLKELYFNFNDINHSLFGNSNLKAEESNNFSGSFKQKFLVTEVLLKAEISAFYNQIYNQISFAQSSISGGDTLVYFNIDENRTKGLNLNFSVLYENVQLNIGSSYIGRYNRLAETNSIEDFSYSMELMGNLIYEFKKTGISLAVFLKHQGELPGFGYNNSGEVVKQSIESYQILDANISRNFLGNRLNVAIGCKNILDVQNVRAMLSGEAHSSGGSSISVGTGKTLFVKLGLKLTKK